MPPKKKGSRNISDRKNNIQSSIQFMDPEQGTEYARVIKILGNCRFICKAQYGEEVLATLCGRMKKGPRVILGDIILASRRDWQQKAQLDIIYKYTQSETQRLKMYGELDNIPEDLYDDHDGDIVFTEEPSVVTEVGASDDIDFNDI